MNRFCLPLGQVRHVGLGRPGVGTGRIRVALEASLGVGGALCGLREIRALSGARGSGDLSALGVPLENWRTRVRSVWYSKIKRNNGRM